MTSVYGDAAVSPTAGGFPKNQNGTAKMTVVYYVHVWAQLRTHTRTHTPEGHIGELVVTFLCLFSDYSKVLGVLKIPIRMYCIFSLELHSSS